MSWAEEQARSRYHMQSMLVLTLDEAKKRLERFEKEYPLVAKFWLEHPLLLLTAHDSVEVTIRTGTQSTSGGPAKPSLVGLTPTPCSKITVKTEDLDPKDGNFGPWLRGEK